VGVPRHTARSGITFPKSQSQAQMNEPAKSIFKSKTAVASAITIVAGMFGSLLPEANAFIAQHASAILLGLGAINLLLRLVTRGRVVLFTE